MRDQFSFIEEAAEKVIREAIENAASMLVNDSIRWGGSNNKLKELVHARAVEIMNTDPEINAKIKSEIVSGIESWNPNRKR